MNKLRIVIGSNDGENMVPTHMGDTDNFYVYDLFEDGKSILIERRKNTSPDENGKHGRSEKMNAILEIIKDSQVVIGMKMSPNFKNISAKTKFQPVVINISSIPAIMETLVKSFDRIYDLVQQKKQNIVSEEIPIL